MVWRYGIYAFILVLAFCSGLILKFATRTQNTNYGSGDFIRIVIFFVACSYFILSAAKWYLDTPDSTLWESFWNIQLKTYYHYLPPLAAFGIVIPALMGKFCQECILRFIRCFIAVFLLIGMLSLIESGRLNNMVYCIMFVICVVLAAIIVLGFQKEMKYLTREDYKICFRQAAPSIVCMVVMLGIYYPNELYLTNVNEFPNTYASFFIVLFIGSLVMGTIVFFIMLLLPKAWFYIVNLVLFGITLMGYVQGMILNKELAVLTGKKQVWTTGEKTVNVAIWMIVIAMVVFYGYYKKKIAKLYQGICIYICLIQIATLGYLIATTDTSEKTNQMSLTINGSMDIAEGNNVLVFVLDLFDSTVLEEIIRQDSGFVEPLSDFVYYRNTTSQFAHTDTAIPYLLTGAGWKEGTYVKEYADYACKQTEMLQMIKNKDYDIGIYTNVGILREPINKIASNYTESTDKKTDIGKTFCTMLKTSFYKITPFLIKDSYVYDSSDISEMVINRTAWDTDNDLPFYNNLIQTGLRIGEGYTNAFRFYHMRGAHGLYYMSEDLQWDSTGRRNDVYSQARGCLKIVYEYLRQLQELGKYDDATIIITADHGNIITYDKETQKNDIVSMPIMLIKKPYSHQNKLVISSAPVSHQELFPTLLQAVGVDWHDYGRTFDEISENEDRERSYLDIWGDEFIIQYTINGDAEILDNWKVIDAKFNEN